MKKKSVVLLSAALSLGLALTACGGASRSAASSGAKEEKEGSTAEGEAGSAEKSSSGGQLDVEVGPTPETIDPQLNSTRDASVMILHAFEGLLRTDKDNNIIGGLAESWEKSDDGLSYTFHLRPGLKWSDGTDLTAKDFVYSWKRLADPATAAPYSYDLMNMIDGFDEAQTGNLDALKVEAPDDNTFLVHLSKPCDYFDKIAAFPVMVPLQEKSVEENGDSWTTNPESYITDGPYKMTEYTDGDRVVFEKNENYWDKEHITFDKIVWHLISDANTAYTAYKQDEIDMIKDVPTEEIAGLRDNPEFRVEPIRGTYYVNFNIAKKPFDDAKVREAMTLAIDRDYVANTIMQGIYSPSKNFVGPGVTDAAENSSFEKVTEEKYGDFFDNSKYQENLEKAKQLLSEAGYPNGQGFPSFSYLVNDNGYNKAVAEYLQSAWKELGLNMTIDVQEWKTMTVNRRAGNYDTARNSWVYDWDDPANLIDLLETNNGNNDGKYSSAEFDALVEKARISTNREERFDLLHQAEQHMLKDYAVAPIASQNDFWMQKENLKNTWHSPSGYWYFMYGSKG